MPVLTPATTFPVPSHHDHRLPHPCHHCQQKRLPCQSKPPVINVSPYRRRRGGTGGGNTAPPIPPPKPAPNPPGRDHAVLPRPTPATRIPTEATSEKKVHPSHRDTRNVTRTPPHPRPTTLSPFLTPHHQPGSPKHQPMGKRGTLALPATERGPPPPTPPPRSAPAKEIPSALGSARAAQSPARRSGWRPGRGKVVVKLDRQARGRPDASAGVMAGD